MRTPLLSAVSAILLLAPGAFAQQRNEEDHKWYTQYGVGWLIYQTPVDNNPGGDVDWNTGFETAAAVGYDMGPLTDSGKWSWALEGEFYYSQTDIDSNDVTKVPGASDRKQKGIAWLGNLIIDYNFTEQTSWYFGGGLGWSPRTKLEPWDQGIYDQKDTSALAYQFKTGLRYNLGGRYDFMLGYRFYATEDLKIDNQADNSSFDIENYQQSIEATVRFGL